MFFNRLSRINVCTKQTNKQTIRKFVKALIFLKQAWTEIDVPLLKYENMIKTNLHVPHTALLQLAKVFITSSPPPSTFSLITCWIGRRKRAWTTESPETACRERKALVPPHSRLLTWCHHWKYPAFSSSPCPTQLPSHPTNECSLQGKVSFHWYSGILE